MEAPAVDYDNWDGQIIEENKATHLKHPNAKSRSNWRTGMCMKFDCVNRDEQCDDCIGFSNYFEVIETESK
jgi:hypothetical protein